MNKIKGQIGGIERMIDEGRNPVDIIQQIIAVKSGLNKVGSDLLKEESKECFKQKNNEQRILKFETLVKNFFKLT